MTDLEIIRLVQKGETDQFAELVRRHHANIIGVCRGILLDPDLAEDAAQDAFVKAFKQISSFQKTSAFSTWLYRIAVNHCLDVRRKNIRQKTDSLDALLANDKEEIVHQPRSPSLEKTAENKDLAQRLLSDLSDQDRAILVLREGQGLSYEEIVDALDISLDAVKSRLKRARQQIQEKARHFSRFENV